MKESKHLRIVCVVIGFILGLSLYRFDVLRDSLNYPLINPWSIVIIAFMITGWVIGNLLYKIFTAQRKREQVIIAEHKRLHELFNSLPGIVIVVGENYKVRFANANYIAEFGEREGKHCFDMFGKENPCENCRIEEIFLNGLPIKNEEVFQNNKIYEVKFQPFNDIDGSRLVIKTLYDITERKNAEQEVSRLQIEMAHLERLNLVGQMAAGIAHEIRNPMTTVRGYLQLLENRLEYQEQRSTFELMIKELDRANMIITDFLSIAKNSTGERYNQNINQVMRHLYPLLEADTYSQNKKIVFEEGEIPDILMNPEEISQLILNLCRNGVEAMGVGGTISIRTYVEDVHVVFSVADEGGGIHSEYLDKLGTPFFTTKESGTGLGLSTCYNIADRHNARIDFESSANGTTFFVRFPRVI